MNYKIANGNIINSGCDAVVLPANEKLREGKGTSAAIFKAAGRLRLSRACRKVGNCPSGCAVPTPAFDLNARYIIHAVVPKWIDGEHKEYEYLCSAYFAALKMADHLGCESIAFPLLASGNNGFDLGLAFEIAVKSIQEFSGTCLKNALLVVYGEETSEFVRAKGYDCDILVEGFNASKITEEKNDLFEKIRGKARIAVDVAANDLIDYALNPDNLEENLKKAALIIDLVRNLSYKKGDEKEDEKEDKREDKKGKKN